jgi:hypothetical protein
MITWIILGVILYLLIGVGILIYSVKTDSYAGFVLHFAIPLILFYPYFIIRSFFSR